MNYTGKNQYKTINRLGEKHYTKEGYKIEIVKYYSPYNCDVMFDTGIILKSKRYHHIKNGDIKNSYHPTVFNTGYIGVGKYKSTENRKITAAYSRWFGILKRCYNGKINSYKNCSVDKRWHNFQVFAEWFENNYREGFHIDKDLLIKGNKTYSSETCCFVPQEINNVILNNKSRRGNHLIGISRNSSNNRFIVHIKRGEITKHLGSFMSIEEAFQTYKKAKEEYIKELANKWKNQITEACYQALINYKVEITD